MGRVIPNEQTWVGFAASIASAELVPTEEEINGATDLTPFLMSLNASSQGNVVPTPSFDTLFETSIVGTSQATFTADFYRDAVADTAWESFPRGTAGYVIVSRFGGSGPDQIPRNGDTVEVWPINVVSRTAANMQNNAVQTFTITCSVNVAPNEAAVVTGAVAGTPSAPRNVVGTATAATTATIDFDAPTYVGAGLTAPYYAVYKSASSGGSYTLCTATIVGTTAQVTGLTTATTSYFKVLAHNAAGDGPLSAASTAVTQP